MLEDVTTDLVFTISLKRSTHKSSAIHKLGRPITPSLPLKRGLKSDIAPCPVRANNGLMHRSNSRFTLLGVIR